MKKFTVIISLLLVVAMTTVLLVSCAPTDVPKAKEKLEKAGYTVIASQPSASESKSGVVGSLVAMKGLLGKDGIVTAILFDSAASAKDAFADYKKEADKDADYTAKQTGKWVIWGDAQGIKDFS